MHINTLDKPYLVQERNTIILPYTPEFRRVIPGTPTVLSLKGKQYYTFPNEPRINSILYTMGHEQLSPIYFDNYDWSNVLPYDAQIDMSAMKVARRRSYNLSDLGVGKTLGTLFAIDWLMIKGYVKKALIVAPLSILKSVWRDEMHYRIPRLTPVVVHGTAAEREYLLKSKWWNVAIINYSGIASVKHLLREINFDYIVLDELATYRNHTTQQWRNTYELVRRAPFAVGLTGSPTPNGPWDIYGQVNMFQPEKLKSMSSREFKQHVAEEVKPGIWTPRKNAAAVVYNLMQPAIRFLRSDVIELKGSTTHTLKVDLSKAQQEFIDELRRDAVAMFAEGIVEAVNAAVLVGKILQGSAGAVYTTGKQVVDLKNTHRIDTAKELVSQSRNKVLLFASYVHLVNLLDRNFEDVPHAVVHGGTPQADRYRAFKSIQDPNDPVRLLIAHPKCLAHGVNLTGANVIIWYGPITSYEIYQQANGRITRAGQKHEQLIYHLQGSPTEARIYRTLRDHGNMQATILDLFATGDI